MGSHHHHHRRSSPSSYSSYTDSDSDHYRPRHSTHRRHKPAKTTYYPYNSRSEADDYYHSDDAAGHRGRSKRSKAPAYVTDPEDEDYEYEIPRSRIGSVEPIPRKSLADDVLAAFGLVRDKKDKGRDTVYVNADGTRADDRDRGNGSRRRRSWFRRRRNDDDYDGSDDSTEDEKDRQKEKHHERNQHLKEAAVGAKVAYSLRKHSKAEKAEKAEKHQHEREEDYERERERRHRHSDHASSSSHRRHRREAELAGAGAEEKHRHDKHRDRSQSDRSRRGRDDTSRSSRSSRSRSGHRRPLDNEHNPDANKALRAAIVAAALEAFRSRKDESGLTSARMMRILSAAIAGGGIDAIMEHHSGSKNEEQMKHIIEAVIGGVSSSQFFGHRIRRRHGIGQRELMKTNMMRMAAGKALDRGAMGHRAKNPRTKKERHHSSNRVSSLWRALNHEKGGA